MRVIQRLNYFAQQQGEGIAIKTEHRESTYNQVVNEVANIMFYLSNNGITSKSIAGIALENEFDHFIVTLALFGLGAGQIIVPMHESILQHKEIVDQVQMTDLILDNITGIRDVNIVQYNRPDYLDSFLTIPESECEGRIFFKTSGTTSRPNIIELSESQFVLQALQRPEYLNETLLCLASIEYNNAKRHRLYSLIHGGINVFKPEGTFDVVNYVIEKNITCLNISRIHASDLVKHAYAKNLSNLKVCTGGSAIPYSLRNAIEKKVTKYLYVRYSAMECGLISMAKPGEHDQDECSGRNIDSVSIEIVDEDDKSLPAGLVGRVRLKAVGMAEGYFNNPEQTKKRFNNGWFYPGDLAYIRRDGQIVIQGRVDDMIIMNGLNIYPVEIEKILENHLAVRTAAALPIESAIHGQIPVAAVELNKSNSVESPELLKYCRGMLGLRSPKKIIILPKLPRNMNGKVVKTELKDLFMK